MSGGHFCYKDSELKGEIFGFFADKPNNALEDMEISELVWDVLDLLHEYDWYYCGDNGRDTYLKAKAAFKEKWFESDRKARIKSIIDRQLDSTRRELYETFGIEVESHDKE